MDKQKTQRPWRKVTKRQLSQWQRQMKRKRIIFGLAIFIIVAVSGIVGMPWYFNQYKPLHQTVIIVNDTEFDMKYYVEKIRLYRTEQSADVAKDIEQNELIRQGALKVGISVSDKEVREELKNSNLPVNDAAKDLARSRMLRDKLLDEYFEEQVPVFTEQRHVMAMLLESESQAAEIKARIEAGEDFGTLAGELSIENLSKDNNGDLYWQPEGMLTITLGTSAVDEYAFNSKVGVLSQPVYDEEIEKGMGYWITKVLERKKEARVVGMLLGSEEEAGRVRDRLEAGEDIDKLAREPRQDELSGWFTTGEAGPTFDEFVFNPDIEVGTISKPITIVTENIEQCYALIKVLERRERARVLGILLGIEEETRRVRERLEAGEDFGELARELSQDEKSRENDGYLNWLTHGNSILALDEFVFSSKTEVGTVSEPVRDENTTTKGGYWLIKIIDKDDNRRIEDNDRDLLKAEALNKWIETLWNDPANKIENYLDDEKEAWAINQAMKP
ncbi:peptidylprolyl isomerase [Chloroflexota bacterium]